MTEYGTQKPKYSSDSLYSWSEAWTAVLTKPSVQTFELLLQDPQATRDRAFKWVLITGTIAVLLNVFVLYVLLGGVPAGAFVTSLLCTVIIGGPIVLLVFAISHGITQWIARMLGGTGEYSAYYYAVACFSAPLILINVALSAFAGSIAFDLVNLAIGIYQIILTGMALKAVNRFGWGQVITVLIIIIVIGAIIGVILLGSLSASFASLGIGL